MKTETLSIDLLRLDGDTQSRVSMHEETVEEYTDVIKSVEKGEWPFDAVDVCHDGSNYFVSDGFHRTLAATRAGRASIPCRVYKGTVIHAKAEK